jgi:hypothetical protein
MGNEVIVKFNKNNSILEVKLDSYSDIVKDGRLDSEFLNSLFEGYRAVENSEKNKHKNKLSLTKKIREAIKKNKKWGELPIKGIHLYPNTISKIKSEDVREIIIKSVALESEYSRIMADRWELFEDLAVGADLLIDISAISLGLYRYLITGEIREGITGFGYLAILGMALLVTYFILRIVGEEPRKRKSRYLTHILETPMNLHRRHLGVTNMTFSVNSD